MCGWIRRCLFSADRAFKCVYLYYLWAWQCIKPPIQSFIRVPVYSLNHTFILGKFR